MDTITIDCSGITTERAFWHAYLETVKPEGAQFFGRNLAAFHDAVIAGGPGWPGECKLHFINTELVRGINDGAFYRGLQSIAATSSAAPILLDAA